MSKMKGLFLLLTLLVFGESYAQKNDCTKYIKADFDKMTGDTTMKGKNTIVALNNGKAISIISTSYQKGDKDIFVVFKVLKGINCVDKNDKIYFLFTDKTRDWSYGRQLYNCKGQFVLMFGGTFGHILLDTLKNKLIKTIRLESSSGTIDFNLTQNQATTFQNQLLCLDTYLRPQESN